MKRAKPFYTRAVEWSKDPELKGAVMPMLKEKIPAVMPLEDVPEFRAIDEQAQAAARELRDTEAAFQHAWTVLHPPPPSATVPMSNPRPSELYEAERAIPGLTDRRLRARILCEELQAEKQRVADQHRTRVDAAVGEEIRMTLRRLLERAELLLEFERELEGLIRKRQACGGSGDLGDHAWNRLFAGIRQLRGVIGKT